MPVLNYREAIRHALAEELERDSNVVVMGEEVAQFNGAYKVTEGLLEKFGPERIVEQDLLFPIRELVDIALRALSPSLNDPTTAVQSLDQIHDLLRRMSSRPAPQHVHVDDENVARFLEHPFDWEALVHEALDEIIEHGASEIQVRRRVEALLRDVLTVALPERRPVLVRECANAMREDQSRRVLP